MIIIDVHNLGFRDMYSSLQEKNTSSLFAISVIAILLMLSGCSSQQVKEDGEIIEDDEVAKVDPYEGFNRSMFNFNDKVDTYVAEPISDAYTWVTPRFVQTGVANFFDNLKGINVVLNDLMQGKGQQGMEDTGRFLMNSTVGVVGLFDVASEVGLEKHDEDFAQTLAVWGVSPGPYLVLPLLGPTTSRGIPGGIFDTAANPASYVGAPVQMVQILNTRANADAGIDFVKEAALDPYVFTRESFLQYRNNLITDGKIEDSDDLFDMDEDFEEVDVEDENQPLVEDAAEQPSEKVVILQVDGDEIIPAQEVKDVIVEKIEKVEKSTNDIDASTIDSEKLNHMEAVQ